MNDVMNQDTLRDTKPRFVKARNFHKKALSATGGFPHNRACRHSPTAADHQSTQGRTRPGACGLSRLNNAPEGGAYGRRMGIAGRGGSTRSGTS